ncbi:olfactory receptor 10AG1-like [Vombatus ursinus]|uniref:olfactory receptor 10AG1-like n=1 Tax=Vombatus ursinus TaxID=29139 RepID=UPI000FFCF87F|nr:olfactory receptor 10AG1-like [Vombatus ursinus]
MNHKEKMGEENLTMVEEFVIPGFYELPNLQVFLFGIFTVIYLSILMRSGLIIVITKTDPALHTPMYFFLGNFSFLETCYTSIILPKMMMNIWTQNRNISFMACVVQLCVFLILGGAECFLLAVMAYDRYVAICKSLHYPVIMNQKVCIQLVVGSWICGCPVQIGQTYLVFSLSFCDSNKINHVFCDIFPLLKLACGGTSINELFVYALAMLFVLVPFLLIIWFYVNIIATILNLPVGMRRSKAFSSCSSHLIVVAFFFGSAIITYLRPKSSHSPGIDKVLSLFYTIVTPMFNPLIYGLRNKDVIAALMKILSK